MNFSLTQLYLQIKRFSIPVLLICAMTGYAQTGNTLQNPIVAGSFSSGFHYTNSQNVSNVPNYDAGCPSNNVFYK